MASEPELDALSFRAAEASTAWSGRVLVRSVAALELLHDAGLRPGGPSVIEASSLLDLLRRIIGRRRGTSPPDMVALLRLAVAATEREAEVHVSPAAST